MANDDDRNLPATRGPVNELYPIPVDHQASTFIRNRVRPERDIRGTMLLDKPLTRDERLLINTRLKEVAPALAPTTRGKIENIVLGMFVAFAHGGWMNETERKVTIAKYVDVLDGLPYFAIAQAAKRFERHEVDPEEVGGKRDFDAARPPNAVQLRIVAENIARPHRDEATLATMLLRSEVNPDRPISEEEKARRKAHVELVMKEITAAAAAASMNDAAAQAERERMRREDAVRRQEQALLEQYHRAGVEPVYCDKDKTMLQSLTMLLDTGWTIEETGGGGRTLISPTGVRKRRGEE